MKSDKLVAWTTTLLLAGALLAACGGAAAPPAPTAPQAAAAPASPAPTAAPAAPATPDAPAVQLPADPKAAILQALRTQATAGPYRTTTTIDMDGDTQSGVGLVVPPDRMHVIMDMGGLQMEMIFVGDKAWTRQGAADWVENDRMGMPGAGPLDESMIADTERTMVEAALVGPQQVDGVDAVVYTYVSDQSKSELLPMQGASRVTLWVAAASGRIIRQEIEDDLAGTPSKTVQVIEYDPTITVEPPVK